MKLLISCPSGFNTREILHPLAHLLESDSSFSEVLILTPAANFQSELFGEFRQKYRFIKNPLSLEGHTRLLADEKPDIILTPTVGLNPHDIPILRAGKKSGIPTLTFIASWDNVFKMERKKNRHEDYELPDYFAVWNQMNHDHLLNVFPEVSKQNVYITGAPRFDFFQHHDRIPSRQDLFTYLKIADHSKKLIHCATTELYPFGYIIKTLWESEMSSQLAIYASVHPGGNIERHNYERYQAITGYSFGRRTQAPLKEFSYFPTFNEIYMHVALFLYADVLINQSSTVAIESMLADTPVINATYGQPRDWWKWYRSMVYRDFKQHYRYITDGGGTSLVRRSQDLVSMTKQYLSHPELKQTERAVTAKKLLTYTDGSSSRRLINLIKTLI